MGKQKTLSNRLALEPLKRLTNKPLVRFRNHVRISSRIGPRAVSGIGIGIGVHFSASGRLSLPPEKNGVGDGPHVGDSAITKWESEVAG